MEHKTIMLVANVGVLIAASALLWAYYHPCDCEKANPQLEVEASE